MVLKLEPLNRFLKYAVLLIFLSSSAILNLSCLQAATAQAHHPQNKTVPKAIYVDEPLDQLLHDVPETKTLQREQDQSQLATILEQCAKNVDMEFKNFTDLTAKESVSENRANPTTDQWGQPKATLNDQPNLFQNEYSYFIVREGTLVETRIREYRRDRFGSGGTEPHALPLLAAVPSLTFLSTNFVSSLLYFSSDLQREERFRYLGEQQVGQQSAYVLAFAQVVGVATMGFAMRATSGETINWFMQGIAWIDKSTFQILQMRTDLLAPLSLLPDCGQDQNQFQTLIQFAALQPNGVSGMVWLPTEADIHEQFRDCKNPLVQNARNVHRFSDYRLYSHDDADAARKEMPDGNPQLYQHAVHPYLELPLPQLMKRVPQLKGISPTSDQKALAKILQQTGQQVDAFFVHLGDLSAKEDITQERLASGTLPGGMPGGTLQAMQRSHDNYLILRHTGNGPPRIEEFRTDAKGKRLEETGVENGFFVTSGFALSSIHFATAYQWDSRFVYLGDQKIGGHDTYVLAFAQLPSESRVEVTIQGKNGTKLRLLSQGIAWVDKSNFHILRLRTDLLTPQPDIGLTEQTTTINYAEARFVDAPPLWLPRDVNVYIQFTEHPSAGARDLGAGVMEEAFRNTHHYSNYLLYRVSTKMGVSP
jgi:hypothetical protein